MATYPKATLNLKYTDENNNQRTFNVGYINPDVADATLREFGGKIIALTDNTLDEVYKTVQENITTPSTDTSAAILPLTSTSDFLSADSDTWTTYTRSLPSDTSTLIVNVSDDEYNANYSAKMSEIRGFATQTGGSDGKFFIDWLNARLINAGSAEKYFTANLAQSGKLNFSTDNLHGDSLEVQLEGQDGAAKTALQSVFDGISEDDKDYETDDYRITWTSRVISATNALIVNGKIQFY